MQECPTFYIENQDKGAFENVADKFYFLFLSFFLTDLRITFHIIGQFSHFTNFPSNLTVDFD